MRKSAGSAILSRDFNLSMIVVVNTGTATIKTTPVAQSERSDQRQKPGRNNAEFTEKQNNLEHGNVSDINHFQFSDKIIRM